MNKTLWRITLLAALLVQGLLACTRVPAADSERGALEGAIMRWVAAVNAHDADTLASTMTPDAELIDAATTVTGREAVLRASNEAAAGKLVATTRELTIADDLAWHVVALSQSSRGVMQSRGQALEIWKRVNGAWRLHRRMTSPASPDVSLTRPSTKEPVLDQPVQ